MRSAIRRQALEADSGSAGQSCAVEFFEEDGNREAGNGSISAPHGRGCDHCRWGYVIRRTFVVVILLNGVRSNPAFAAPNRRASWSRVVRGCSVTAIKKPPATTFLASPTRARISSRSCSLRLVASLATSRASAYSFARSRRRSSSGEPYTRLAPTSSMLPIPRPPSNGTIGTSSGILERRQGIFTDTCQPAAPGSNLPSSGPGIMMNRVGPGSRRERDYAPRVAYAMQPIVENCESRPTAARRRRRRPWRRTACSRPARNSTPIGCKCRNARGSHTQPLYGRRVPRRHRAKSRFSTRRTNYHPIVLHVKKKSLTRLLDAALELLGRSGAGGLTVRAVEDVVGLPHGSVRHHFGHRLGLVTALFDRLADRESEVAASGSSEALEQWPGRVAT